MAKTLVNNNFNGDFKVIIQHRIKDGYELQEPIVEDGVVWETEREGVAGKLTFKVYKDDSGNLNFQEGDAVELKFQDSTDGWVTIFKGYIFTKKRNKDGWINVTAYDQLRYLKNKDTYVYTKKTASEVVKMICNDYLLNIGAIEDTNYVIAERAEDNQGLFDIIQNALTLTQASTGKKYVLYDAAGKIYLRNIDSLKTNVVINDCSAGDFDYSSSIDEETYDEVELYYDNDETNKREYYTWRDLSNIDNWGRLRYTESLQDRTNAKERAKQLLHLYNRKTRSLSVKDAFGDYRCRGGASVIVDLSLGDMKVKNYMVIESAKHTFKKNDYRMELKLDIVSNEKYNSTNEIYSERNVVDPPRTTPKNNGGTNNTNTDGNDSASKTKVDYTKKIDFTVYTNYEDDADIYAKRPQVSIQYYKFGKTQEEVALYSAVPCVETLPNDKRATAHSFTGSTYYGSRVILKVTYPFQLKYEMSPENAYIDRKVYANGNGLTYEFVLKDKCSISITGHGGRWA